MLADLLLLALALALTLALAERITRRARARQLDAEQNRTRELHVLYRDELAAEAAKWRACVEQAYMNGRADEASAQRATRSAAGVKASATRRLRNITVVDGVTLEEPVHAD